MSARLSVADLCFINRVAARRFAGAEPAQPDLAVLTEALEGANSALPLERVAELVAPLLRRAAFSSAPLQTALLVVHCALSLEGFFLLAPQGVIVGMIRGLAGDGDAAAFARWLEDRTVPSTSGG